jgi:hypothetical protein
MILGLLNRAAKLTGILVVASLAASTNPISALAGAAGDKPAPSEQQVKAAFLFNFIKFINWPQGAFPDKNSPIQVGIIGDDALGRELEQSLHGKSINGREIKLRQTGWPADTTGYHILLLCTSEAQSIPSILASVKGSPVLTVGDMERFGEKGGIINFYIEEKKVRFEINIDAAEKARLKISSQLLSLARIIRDDPRAGRM